jgi:uncharacterized protein (TIRG00374 family)
MRIGRRALLRAALGIGVSLLALWFLFQSVDVGAALQVLAGADLRWVALMLVTALIDVAARAARWRWLLLPIQTVRYLRMLGYTYIGYLANNVLPARLGELVRSHAAGEGEGLSRTTVLGTVVVERVVDTVIVVGLAALAVLVLSARGIMTSAVLLGAAFVALLVLGLGLAMAMHRLPGADRIAAFMARWPRIVELARRLREGLAVAGKPRTLAGALVFSAIAWSASIGTFIFAGRAIGVDLNIAQAALVCSGVALATIIPSGPGSLGTFELTAVGIMTTFGIDPDSAFALALLAHAMNYVVTSVGGIIAAIRMDVGFDTGSGDDTGPRQEEASPTTADAPVAATR